MILEPKLFKGTYVQSPGQSPVNELVLLREDDTHLIWSNNWFQTINRVTTNSIKACGFNGQLCGWYIEGSSETALTFHYTNDGGSTWLTTPAPYMSRWAVSSDNGRYWILGGNTNSGSNYFQKVCVADVWTWTPSSIYYGNTYGGRYSMISRDGQYSVLSNRSYGLAYNFNFLDASSWLMGMYQNTLSYPIVFGWDLSCWCTAVNSWADNSYYSFNLDFTSGLNYINANPARPYAFAQGVIGFTDSVNNNHYRSVQGSPITLIDSYDASIGTDDGNTFEFKINSDTGLAICNGNSVANVNVQCFYVSRDGWSVFYVNSATNQLFLSHDKGLSWTNVTPTTSYISSSAYLKAQWNHSIF